jgi:transposase InsO family protein
MASSNLSAPVTAAPSIPFMSARSTAWARVYQQTIVDTCSKAAFAKLYDHKTPLPAAALLNDRVVPFFESYGIALARVLTDRGTEYCGNPEHHEYELYLAVENIDPARTKARSPRSNGIAERLHKTMLKEFYRIAFRRNIYDSIAALQTDLDAWLDQYNNERQHQGRWWYGKTAMRTILDSLELATEKLIPH